MQKRSFWQLGGRTWKTVAATFISLIVDGARPGGMPFYAAITAIFCTQKNVRDSFETSINREISTVAGGLFGMLFLFAEKWIGGPGTATLRYGVIALVLVPIISASVWLGRPKSTFLMCVVFLSVTTVHDVDVHPFYYALNRILDTTIGIVTALVVNLLPGRILSFFKKRTETHGTGGESETTKQAADDPPEQR